MAVAADHGLTDHAALLRRAPWLLARRLWDERTGAHAGTKTSSQSWGKRQDRWLLLNELKTNDSQTAARALGLVLTLLRAAGSRGTRTRFLHGQSAYERSINDRSIRSIACSIGTGSTARYPTNGRSCASRTKNADDAPTA